MDVSVYKCLGQMMLVGFDGYEVTPDIRTLIRDNYVGNIMLSRKNVKSAEQVATLVQDLQKIAFDAGHEFPLAVSIDQEGGLMSSITEAESLTMFPGGMALAATRSTVLAERISEAAGKELRALGIWWNFAPVLDVLTNPSETIIGTRAIGDSPKTVAEFGVAAVKGLHKAGVSSLGKHFPGYGAVHSENMGTAAVIEPLEQLELTSFLPFRQSIEQGLDSILVGACTMPNLITDGLIACLSSLIVRDILRHELNFDGIIVSDCLAISVVHENFGIGQGTVSAVLAGCDIILVCRSLKFQQEAIAALQNAAQTGAIDLKDIFKSYNRIKDWKKRYISWDQCFLPVERSMNILRNFNKYHYSLVTSAYQSAVTVVRDRPSTLPLSKHLSKEGSKLTLLTPLALPGPYRTYSEENSLYDLAPGELTFRMFGLQLARYHKAVEHASYSSHGLDDMCERLVVEAGAVIVVTANAANNLYQRSVVRHVRALCAFSEKPLVVVAVSNPYDFALDESVPVFLCTYDISKQALQACADVLFGSLSATGTLPVSTKPALDGQDRFKQYENAWNVETWTPKHGVAGIENLLRECFPGICLSEQFLLQELSHPNAWSCIVRDKGRVVGFCATIVAESQKFGPIIGPTGRVAVLAVDPAYRRHFIGPTLHHTALRHLFRSRNVAKVVFAHEYMLLVPHVLLKKCSHMLQFLTLQEWHIEGALDLLQIENLGSWQPPLQQLEECMNQGIKFVNGSDELLIQLFTLMYAYNDTVMSTFLDIVESNELENVIIAIRNDSEIVGLIVTSKVVDQMTAKSRNQKSIGRIYSLSLFSQDKLVYDLVAIGLLVSAVMQLRKQGFDESYLEIVNEKLPDLLFEEVGFVGHVRMPIMSRYSGQFRYVH